MRYLALLLCLLASPLHAEMAPREGWTVIETEKSFEGLIEAVRASARSNSMGIVTQAGPTKAAKSRGITIPGNRIIGIFNNVYAVRILGLSTAAMIEAPTRMYVTENADATATLSYKKPSTVFDPYMSEAGPDLEAAAGELDAIFQAIADGATN